MKINGYFVLFAALVILLVCAAGCTIPQAPGATTPVPSGSAAVTGS